MSADVAAEGRRPVRRWLVAVVLALVGAACIGAALRHSPGRPVAKAVGPASSASSAAPGSPRSPASPASSASTAPRPARVAGPRLMQATPPRRPERVAGPAAASPPVHLSIPVIDVSQRLLRLGLQPDRTVEVPAPRDSEYPGWYRLGAMPGQVGSAVILGHVDSSTGPAVFYELRRLVRGDRVDVRLENGAVAHFEVRSVRTYPNEDFPARKVYASQGVAALNLVTCGGDYDSSRGGYQANVVVNARKV